MSKTIPLAHLEAMTVCFNNFAETLGRPLLLSERQHWKFILALWESEAIKKSLKRATPEKLDEYHELMAELRERINPDPIQKLRIGHKNPEQVTEHHEGNFAPNMGQRKGMFVPRLTAREATERLGLLAKLAAGMAVVCYELSLVRDRDKPEAAAMVRCAEKMLALEGEYAMKFRAAPQISEKPSADEEEANARALSDWMGPLDGVGVDIEPDPFLDDSPSPDASVAIAR